MVCMPPVLMCLIMTMIMRARVVMGMLMAVIMMVIMAVMNRPCRGGRMNRLHIGHIVIL